MSAGGFNLLPQPGESEEQHAHRVREAVLAENWTLRFEANGAEHRALGVELFAEQNLYRDQDPDKIAELIDQRQTSLIRCLGSGAISLWQRDVLAEREQFEADFGQSDQS